MNNYDLVENYNTPGTDIKYPYYRLTDYMDDEFQDEELETWFQFLMDRGIPCCIAMGKEFYTFGRLAVWIWGEEMVDGECTGNDEEIGRIVMGAFWPENPDEHNIRLYYSGTSRR